MPLVISARQSTGLQSWKVCAIHNGSAPVNWARYQSEHHPLVAAAPSTPAEYVLSLIHQKAYRYAASRAFGLDVLDLGCNSGYGTAILAGSCRRAVGADVSEVAIDVARKANAAANIDYVLIDGGELPFGDREFDIVTSFQVIEHIEDVPQYLREVARVLRPDGLLILTTPNASIRLNQGMKPWNPFHLVEYTVDGLRATLAAVFTDVAILGLFGPEEVQRLELQRVDASKRAQLRESRDLSRRVWRLLRGSLPDYAVHKLYLLRPLLSRSSRAGEHPSLESVMSQNGLDDLYYESRPERLDQALDLLALCERPLST